MGNRNIFKEAFTLAEIMIVLTVIGVLTAILLPTAFHSSPDENILKFKKSQVSLASVIRELATTGQYYKEGDLRYKAEPDADGNDVAVDNNYLCKAIADLITTKAVNCENNNKDTTVYCKQFTDSSETTCNTEAKFCNLDKAKEKLDSVCSSITSPKGITTQDDVIWYEAKQTTVLQDPACKDVDCNFAYKVFCLKIDTLYFGFGIRSDGKMLTGKNADIYIKESITQQ